MAPAAARRTLWLLRHAKTVTDPPPGGSDFDRVLAPRGRRDANALGRLFAGKGEGLGRRSRRRRGPTVALVSPAARTRATAELVLAHVSDPPEQRFEEDLYGADPAEVMAYLHGLPDDVAAAMVVGHNPTAHSLSRALLSPRDQKGIELTTRRASRPARSGSTPSRPTHGRTWTAGGAKLAALMVPPYGEDRDRG